MHITLLLTTFSHCILHYSFLLIYSTLACINIYAEITFHNTLDYWTYLKNNQDIVDSINYSDIGKNVHSSLKVVSENFSHTKVKQKGTRGDFLPFSRNGGFQDELNTFSNSLSSDNVKSTLAEQISGKHLSIDNSDHIRDIADVQSEGNDVSNENEFKWNHSLRISGSLMKNKINADSTRKAHLSTAISKPLEFDRKCAWDIHWAAVSKSNYLFVIYYSCQNLGRKSCSGILNLK